MKKNVFREKLNDNITKEELVELTGVLTRSVDILHEVSPLMSKSTKILKTIIKSSFKYVHFNEVEVNCLRYELDKEFFCVRKKFSDKDNLYALEGTKYDEKRIAKRNVDITIDDPSLKPILKTSLIKKIEYVNDEICLTNYLTHYYLKNDNGKEKVVYEIDTATNNLFDEDIISPSLISYAITGYCLFKGIQTFFIPVLNQSYVYVNEYHFAFHLKRAYEILLPFINCLYKKAPSHCDIFYLFKTKMINIEDMKKKSKSNESLYLYGILSENSNKRIFTFKTGSENLENVLKEYSRANKRRYLVYDFIEEFQINNLNFTAVRSFTNIKFYLSKLKKVKGKEEIKKLFKLIDKASKLDKETKEKFNTDYKNIEKERNEKIRPLIDEVFSIIEKIQDEENKPLMEKLNLFLKTKEDYYAYFLDGRIDIDLATRKSKYDDDNLLYCEISKYKDFEISCALYTLFNTAIMNAIPPIEYIAYLIETLGSEEKVELDKLLPWSKEIESLYEN